MTKQEIITGNVIIAIFMGATVNLEYKDELTYYYDPKKAPTKHSSYNWQISAMQYHESWDWLMPVVEKIFILREVANVIITPGTTTIIIKTALSIKSPVLPENDSITECFIAVIEFLTWYNKQK